MRLIFNGLNVKNKKKEDNAGLSSFHNVRTGLTVFPKP